MAPPAPSADERPRRGGGWLLAIFVLALVIRAVAIDRTAVIFNDGPIFLAISDRIAAGDWSAAFAFDQHPGYPLLIALGRWLGVDAFSSATGVSLLFGCLSVVALYALLAAGWPSRIAAMGALLLAINPYAVRFSADVQSESPYLFFFLLAMGLLFRALRAGSFRLALLAGGAAGLAYWVRPEGIGVVLIGGLLGGLAWLRGGWSGRASLAWLAALSTGAALVMAPYLFFVRMASGDFRLSQKKSVLALLGLESTGDGALANPFLSGDLLPWIAAGAAGIAGGVVLWRLRGTERVRVRVGALAMTLSVGFLTLLAAMLAPGPFGALAATLVSTLRPEVLVLVVIGVLAGARRGPSGRTLFIALSVGLYIALLFGLLLAYGYVSRRHALPPLSLLLGYGAAGAWVIADALKGRLQSGGVRRPEGLAALLVGAALVLISLPKAWHDYRVEELPARRAAEWVAAQADRGGHVASNRMKAGYYAEREWRPLQIHGERVRLDDLGQWGVRWVIAEPDALSAQGRRVAALADTERFQLSERHVEPGERGKVTVFEVVESAGGAP